MYSKVKVLRQRGVRRHQNEISSDPGKIGHLTMVGVAGVLELKLHGPEDDSQRKPIIPVLFHAKMTTMHGARMLFQGCEDPAAPDCIQEWAVEIMVAQPLRQE
jgi:hypothetical protein